MASNGKKYVQPYSSRHVVSNTHDSIRTDESSYIRNFPRLLHLLYRKQTPFHPAVLNTIKLLSEKPVIRKSASAKTLERTKTPSSQKTPHQQHQAGFKTIGKATTKSPTQQMSSIPSDFEHIFHYSETQ